MAGELDRIKDDIRRRTDLVDLVGQRVLLKKAGRNWKGLCPFHDDKNPSFIVSPEYGHYRCWSCGAKGDVFNWVMETQKLDFGQALAQLAKQAGVELPKRGREQPAPSPTFDDAMTEAQAFFRETLGKSALAREYVGKRSLSTETLDKWGIGYAPDVGEALAVRLQKKGLSLAECKQLFLVDTDAGGGYFDKFRGRLMFPIRDERGRLVAFGGRLLGDGVPKYINSGDTPIYSKSRVLYGMDQAKDAIAKKNAAIIVEGYLDVIACHAAGVDNAVASLGTALTDDQARLLKRWCDKVTLLYDSDAAGIKAADRGSEILQAAGLLVSVALLPEGDDPDTLLKREGAPAVIQASDAGMTPMEFRLQSLRSRLSPSSDDYWKEVVQILARATNPLELQKHLLPIAAEYPGIKDKQSARKALENMVAAERKSKSGKPSYKQAEAAIETYAVAPKFEWNGAERTLFRCLSEQTLAARAWACLSDDDLFTTVDAERTAAAISDAHPHFPGLPAPEWVQSVAAEVRDAILDLWMSAGAPPSQESLDEAVSRLERSRQERLAKDMAASASSDDDLRALSHRLKSLKGE